ncbi:synaptogyrin-3-like isoform X1 [Lethenteron reissneri]|uniref:synaptogyrin-3-like isoform X1 n=1 Tax=Lethenteron reissneri TaxID=7753 RepID=UPI002AB7BDF7|nr:synaptogyrin-3-like isoform X1 [Lethenteron reissneri]
MEATEAGAAVPAGAAYGAGRAGGAFDPVAFMKQPHSILRVVSWFFSIVVFGCIVNEGYTNNQGSKLHCIFNGNGDACRYGITIGVVAFFACVAFLALDAYFPQISSVKDRKRAVLADLAFSAFWAFMWFVGFCLLTNQWQETPDSKVPNGIGADSARATIAFCFFSIISWSGIAFLALRRFRLGADAAFSSPFGDGGAGIADGDNIMPVPTPPYATGSGVEGEEAYSKPPFSQAVPTANTFATPAY